MKNQQQMSPEELDKKKQEMLDFYKTSTPYLEAQLKYENLLAELDEVRLRRLKAQHEFAYLSMTPEQEAEMRKQAEKVMAEEELEVNPKAQKTTKASTKERKLKTE